MGIEFDETRIVSGASINMNVGTFDSERGQEVFSPSSPDLYIVDHEVNVHSKFGESGYSISQVPANFDFLSNSKISDTYDFLIDAAGSKGEEQYKGRIEHERGRIVETYERLQTSHNTLILKWKCGGENVPFGGGGGLHVTTKVSVARFLAPDGLETRTNLHLARINHPPAERVQKGENLKLSHFSFFRRRRGKVYISGPQEQIEEIHQVKYSTETRRDVRTEAGPSHWSVKQIDRTVKAEVTMVSGHVKTFTRSL